MLSEQSLRGYILLVENIHQRDGILGETGRENDDFEVLANLVDEFAAVWPHIYENVVDAAFDIDREHDISLVCFIEA